MGNDLRFKCLIYLVRNYPSWPLPIETSHTKACHFGYHWVLDGSWRLENDEVGDEITEEDLSEFRADKMNYSRLSLEAAVVYAMPNGDQALSSMSLPNCLDEACVALFLNEDFHSEESVLIRQATSDLRKYGQLLCNDSKG